MTTQPEPPTQHGGGFFTWLRGLGVNRGGDRWFAGVAGGLAARAGIDPLIVRGVFVVLAIVGGPALLIYAAGWLLLPNGAGRIHVEDIVRGRADSGVITVAVIAAAVLVVPALFLGINSAGIGFGLPFGFGAWDLWDAIGLPGWLSATMAWLFWIAVIVAAAFWARHLLIKRGREQRATFVAGPATGPGAHSTTEAPPTAVPPTELPHTATATDWTQNLTDQATCLGDKAGKWGEETGQRVDAWSARLAEDYEARKIGAGHILITLAFALLAAGFAAFITLKSGFEFTASGATVAAFAAPMVAAIIAALAVLALSMIIAGVRGRHTGFIGFLSFCGVIALLVTAVLPWGTRFQPVGEMHVDGRSAPGAVNLAGNIELNLSDLDRHTRSRVDLDVWQLAGDVNVTLPVAMPTVLEVRMLAGRIEETASVQSPTDLEDRSTSGPFISRTIGVNLPPRATVDSPGNASHVTVYVLAGTVDVVQPDRLELQQRLLEETNR